MGDGQGPEADGYRSGATEKKLGVAANQEECLEMVKKREPNANGATFCVAPKCFGNCFAEFGMTWNDSNEKYRTCPISGMSLFDSLNKFKIFSNKYFQEI